MSGWQTLGRIVQASIGVPVKREELATHFVRSSCCPHFQKVFLHIPPIYQVVLFQLNQQ